MFRGFPLAEVARNKILAFVELMNENLDRGASAPRSFFLRPYSRNPFTGLPF